MPPSTGSAAHSVLVRCRDAVQPRSSASGSAGMVTVSYRLWSRPKVKVGGVYRSGTAMIEIDDIELLPFSSITDASSGA